jgi:hypothetical protein
MPLSLTLACLWIVAACAAGMAPARYHWSAAWTLIATGIPLLGLVTFAMGPVWGLLVMAAGASVLRWPIIRAGQRLAGLLAPREHEHPGE